MLDHEKLDVYQCSIEYLALSVQVIETLPRGSAMECAAILDVLNVLKIIQPPLFDEGKQLLHRIVSMLTKMCRRIH